VYATITQGCQVDTSTFKLIPEGWLIQMRDFHITETGTDFRGNTVDYGFELGWNGTPVYLIKVHYGVTLEIHYNCEVQPIQGKRIFNELTTAILTPTEQKALWAWLISIK